MIDARGGDRGEKQHGFWTSSCFLSIPRSLLRSRVCFGFFKVTIINKALVFSGDLVALPISIQHIPTVQLVHLRKGLIELYVSPPVLQNLSCRPQCPHFLLFVSFVFCFFLGGRLKKRTSTK